MGHRCYPNRFSKSIGTSTGSSFVFSFKRAFERAKTIEGRGYYFDFIEFLKNHEKRNDSKHSGYSTHPWTIIYTWRKIFEEGVEQRHARHAKLNQDVHNWVEKNGFELLPEKQYASKSLTCVRNNLDIDVSGFVKTLKEEKKLSIDGGYGKIKGKTFRISNMGNESSDSIDFLLSQMDEILPRFI